MATGVLTPVPSGDTTDTHPAAGEGQPAAVPTAGTTGSDVTVAPPSDNHPTIAPATPASTSSRLGMLGPGQTLGTRYHIIRLLGVGGMGAVYHAWDGELGVAVALKVIRPDASADPEAAAAIERRFKRELLLARQVTHKHVVRIYDLGDVDGLKYITMSYLQGADLATVLRQAGRLSVQRALRYTRQIVDGLVAAHDAGVVHRDLKPANIMIDEDDQALIMDFGIARSSESPAGSVAGRVVGTLAYMAPEQAQAEPTDQRADIYALGMMVGEMLVGRRRPLDEQNALADLMQRMREAPTRVRAIDPAIPEPLDEIVARCVEPHPANRFQTSRDLAKALEELDENGHRRAPAVTASVPVVAPPSASRWRLAAIAMMAIAVIGIAASLLLKRPSPSAPPQPIEPVSILVADFDNKTGDAVFDGALEQPLTIAIEGASFVNAFARRDALALARGLKGPEARLDRPTARLIAFREGVNYTLAGSVAKNGTAFALQLDLIDPDGNVVESPAAEASSKGDVLGAVGALAAKIRTHIGDKTVDGSKPASGETFTAASLDAFHEYAIAQDLAMVGRDEEAVAHYQRAIQFDANFGRAYSGLAVSGQRLGHTEDATVASSKALALMDRMTDREKYRTLGAYYLGTVRNFEKAVENYSALVQAYPLDSGGYANLALAHFYLRDFAKALEEGRRAVALSPKAVLQRANLALYAMYAGDFSGAAAASTKVLAEQPSYFSAYLPLAMDAVTRGDLTAALRAYNDMAKASPRGASLASIGRADLALYSGRAADAEAELQTGISGDLAAHNVRGTALKNVALAEALIAVGKKPQAGKAVADALVRTRQLATLVPAARAAIALGRVSDARAIAAELESQLQKQNRAYGKIVLAEIALNDKKTAEAADLLGQSRQLADVWLGRFDLGVTYVQAGHFAEALSELEACEKRRGEATALFFDDVPSVRYLATLPYWIGRAQEGLGMLGPARTRYESFINLRKDAAGDPLLEDARRRTAGR